MSSSNEELLKLHVGTMVPFLIYDIIEEGGITGCHIWQARQYVDTLASEGDMILYRGKCGKTAHAVSALCRCLAILAFAPGGITFMGLHFEEKTGQALEALFASLKLEDFEKLKKAMEAEER